MRIISNFKNLDRVVPADGHLTHEYVGGDGALRFLGRCLRSDLVIINVDPKKLAIACVARWLLPVIRFRLVAVDTVLRAPETGRAKLKAAALKLLFSRVDKFIFYFKDLRGYGRHFGIRPPRAVYVPFKVNDWEKMHLWSETTSGGDYVMCAGRTMRDVNTFVEAMRRVECPGLLHRQQAEEMAEHGTPSWEGELPPNLKLVVDDSHRHEVFLDFIARSRLVVIPRFRNDIGPAGIATYLVAMALNKCVIISEGPGVSDVLTDEAVVVPPEDPGALAEQIELLWNDDQLRAAVASRGRQYAMSLGGEDRLLSDFLRVGLDGLPRHEG